jgi:hypothetical protein
MNAMTSFPPAGRDAIVREFARALRAIREEETERLRLTLYELELLRDGVVELRRELRSMWR